MTNEKRPSKIIASIAAAGLGIGVTACNFVDDEPSSPAGDSTVEESGGGSDCLEQLEAAEAQCLPGMQFFATYDEGSTMIMAGAPGASIELGHGAWLIRVDGPGDYVGTYQQEGESCSVGCGWCQPGESLCHSGLDEDGVPRGCMLCLPHDTPDAEGQCMQFIEACHGEGGLDETG
jgi:hypothetical protein